MAIRTLLCADGNSVHTIRWALALKEQGVEIGLFSMQPVTHDFFADSDMPIDDQRLIQTSSRPANFKKIGYLSALPRLKKMVRSFKPDILHAHFASSYGLLGALSGFKPYVLSVWGTDVFDFPKRNLVCKSILRFNLARAHTVLSTSHVMAEETSKYTRKPITVTPFGVDLEKFCPLKQHDSDAKEFTFGTIKALEPIYGIDLLLKAFANFYRKHHVGKLVIAGGGSESASLKRLCDDLQIVERVDFLGRVSHEQVPSLLNSMDVFLALSRVKESFGVAVVEAQACGLPVIVSNMGGLPEVVEQNVTGFVVQNESYEAAAEAMDKLFLDRELGNRMGAAGRSRVEALYDWDRNVAQMVEIYQTLLQR